MVPGRRFSVNPRSTLTSALISWQNIQCVPFTFCELTIVFMCTEVNPEFKRLVTTAQQTNGFTSSKDEGEQRRMNNGGCD